MADPTLPTRPDLAAPPLASRARELAALRAALDAALAGRGSLVLVAGEAGIGKTALAEASCAEAADHGALVLVGRCYDLAETPPYGPWAEALARAPAAPDGPPRPDLAGAIGGSGQPASQAALFAAVRDYLAALAAARPLVLLLDDLHWADPASLELLRALARGLADAPLLLLATYRADELTRRHPLYQFLPLLVREARAVRLDLRPLDEAGLRALVRARYALAPGDEARLVAHLATHAEGNPFYAGELLRTLEGERALRRDDGAWRLGDLAAARVPPLLRQLIDARVDRLGEATRALLAVAATIGQVVPLDLWRGVADADEAAILPTAEAATEARLLGVAEDGSGIRFAHALIREALYEGILPLRRRVWHRRIGEALSATADPDPDAVAYHFRQAGDGRAYEWLVRAGDRAQRAYAWLTAADRYEAALALLGVGDDAAARIRLLFQLARLRRYADTHGSIAYLDEAERLARAGADSAISAGIALERGLFRCFVGELRRGLAEMAAGVAAYDTLAPDERARVTALRMDFVGPTEDDGRGTLALWLAIAGRYAEARQQGERVVAQAERSPRSVYAPDGYIGLATALAGLGQPDAAGQAFATARATFLAIGHHSLVAGSALNQLELVALPYAADRLEERRSLVALAAQARARAGGVNSNADLARLDGILLLELEGHWDEVRALADAHRGSLDTVWWTPLGHVSARLARHQGRPDESAALLGELLGNGPRTEPGDTDFPHAVALQRVAAALALDGGDLPTARAWLAAHDRWLAWAGAVLGQAEAQLGWAAYHRAAGDPATARAHAERALALAGEPRQPLALLAARRLLGELATDAEQFDEAQSHLAAALALADACAAPYERALTLLALAALHVADGDRTAATATLAEARATLAQLDAQPALARADALAARLAALITTPPAAPALPFGLTAREAEVLRLVAQGLTNAQAADRLFVTPRTVNAHLTSIYGKLGVEGRAAAIRLALDHGLR